MGGVDMQTASLAAGVTKQFSPLGEVVSRVAAAPGGKSPTTPSIRTAPSRAARRAEASPDLVSPTRPTDTAQCLLHKTSARGALSTRHQRGFDHTKRIKDLLVRLQTTSLSRGGEGREPHSSAVVVSARRLPGGRLSADPNHAAARAPRQHPEGLFRSGARSR